MRHALAILALVVSATAAAQEKVTEHTVRLAADATPPKASVADMAWLAGRWTGDGLGGRTEEVWSAPDGGVMLGTFRLIRNDKPVFYEFLTLSESERGLVMRLKHFHPDLTGWEERDKFVEFRYAGTIDGVIHFDGLTFRREGEDAMTIFLALRQKSGEMREEKFQMRRQGAQR
ncbi:MAG TPA: DUF6265 family protein [Thermoanaerobaculia bacterium]|nr:DUF6265 family protein [Thermoanaerobaculia bacterium]